MSGPRRCLHRGTWSCSPLHRGPTDHKRSVGPLLSLPEVCNQLFSFAHVQRETVVLAPWCKSLYLIQICGLIIVVNEAQNHIIISKFNNRGGAVRGHAVVDVERVEQGAQDTALWGSYVQGDGVGGELADFHHLWSGGEEILNPVTKWRFESRLGQNRYTLSTINTITEHYNRA